MLRPPRPHDFATGPNVCVAVPRTPVIRAMPALDPSLADLLIDGDAHTGVYVTLPRGGLDLLISELESVHDGAAGPVGVDPGSRWALEPRERATNPTQPSITGPGQRRGK
jgi:hypothetical protein